MKSNKEIVYDFISRYTNPKEDRGLSTQYLTKKLGMQRTNISTILNLLVKEEKVEKVQGRPVLYRLKETSRAQGEISCFKNLIGYEGSMKRAVQLAKAAMLYPEHSLHSLVIGPRGSGKSYFATLMHEFAIENKIIQEDAPFIRFNCRNYRDDEEQMMRELFELDKGRSYLHQADNGILFLDHVEFLTGTARNRLFNFLENNMTMDVQGEPQHFNLILICAIDEETSKQVIERYSAKFSVQISIPELIERPLGERFELIKHFFMIEALRTNRILTVNSDVLQSLLLYECVNNVKQLRTDIQIACANAYVREFNNDSGTLVIHVSDFQSYVSKGILYFKKFRKELEELIPEKYSYKFSGKNIEVQETIYKRELESRNIYEAINIKVEELRERGISELDISTIVSADIGHKIRQYSNNLSEKIVNKEQLRKIVGDRIINLVSEMLDEAGKHFERVYPVSVFYGLCLHLDSAMKRSNSTQKLSNQQIMDIVQGYKQEYQFCLDFSSRIEKEFEISLPIDEVILLTMFISEKSLTSINDQKPVVLVAMHGNNTASSITDVINNLVNGNNTFSYDMNLDKDPKEAYVELRDTMKRIHRGRGILIIYDMGSLKTMATMIAEETGIEVKLIEMPVTLIGLECSRKALMDEDINKVYESTMESYQTLQENLKFFYRRTKGNRKAILTLCMTGEGGAVQVKNYIKDKLELSQVDIIPLAISDHNQLLSEVNEILAKYEILCVVGTYDPNLYGIRFIPITKLFHSDAKEMADLLGIPSKMLISKKDYSDIYDYLGEQLVNVDIDRLQTTLPKVLEGLNEIQELSEDQELGLLVHLASSVSRIIAKASTVVNENKESIIRKYNKEYLRTKEELKKLEDEFKIKFNDDEISFVLSVIKKL